MSFYISPEKNKSKGTLQSAIKMYTNEIVINI